jgi:hypothetical protein
VIFKTFEEAANAVDEMFESTKLDNEDSGDESGDDEDDRSAVAEAEEDGAVADDQVSIQPGFTLFVVLIGIYSPQTALVHPTT